MSGTARTATAVALVVMLTACSAPAPDPTPSLTSASGEPAAAPAPTPTSALADPTTWTIGFTGVGPIALGDDIGDIREKAAGWGELDQHLECPWLAILRQGDMELWLVLEQPDMRLVQEIVIVGEGPSTAEGIGVGSTLDDARAAYPGSSEFVGIGESVNLTVSDGVGHWIHFSSASGDEPVATIDVSLNQGSGYEYCS